MKNSFMKKRYQVKWLIFMYGGDIVSAITLDELLCHIKSNDFTGFKLIDQSKPIHRNITSDLDYLCQEGLIKPYDDHFYSITKKGELKLSSGGFTGDAKKDKNALYAFRISMVAIVIALISFILSLFD